MAQVLDYEAFHDQVERLWNQLQLSPRRLSRKETLLQVIAPALEDEVIPMYYFTKARVIHATLTGPSLDLVSHKQEISYAQGAVGSVLIGAGISRGEGATVERKAWLQTQLKTIEQDFAEREKK